MATSSEDSDISADEYALFLNSGLVREQSFVRISFDGEKSIEFKWKFGQLTSDIAREAVYRYLLKMADLGEGSGRAEYNQRMDTVTIVLSGEQAEGFLQHNFANRVRER